MIKKYGIYIIVLISMLFMPVLKARSQDSTGVSPEPETEYTRQTFWTTRVINGHSIENLGYGELDVKISHRMGRIDSGPKELFGLYQAVSQFGLEYGLNDRLMTGIASTVYDKIYMGFLKYKLIRQSTGKRMMPVTVSYYVNMEIKTNTIDAPDNQYYPSSRFYYTHQLLIGSKVSEVLSLQLTPTLIHRNLVLTRQDKNNVFSVGFSGRLKLSKKLALTTEYFYVPKGQIYSAVGGQDVTNSFSVGIDIYTGKHVFQVFITNSTAVDEKSFITETTDKWPKDIHLGFNIARIFTVATKEE